jgi:hypothetical protein
MPRSSASGEPTDLRTGHRRRATRATPFPDLTDSREASGRSRGAAERRIARLERAQPAGLSLCPTTERLEEPR